MLIIDYRYVDLCVYFYCCSCYLKLLVDKEPDPKSYQSCTCLSIIFACSRLLNPYTYAYSMVPLQMLVYVLYIL